ncbi:hypothetical protein D3C78_1110950 [compost metagenome]
MLTQQFNFSGDLFFQLDFGLAITHLLQLCFKTLYRILGSFGQSISRCYQFFTRRYENVLDLIYRALISRVKGTNRINLIIKQLYSIGQCRGKRIEINDSAANTHFSARFNSFYSLIPELNHLIQEMIKLKRTSQLNA